MKNLKDKAISIKGKSYILVADRVLFFNETYPNGCIQTHLVSQPTEPRVIVKAKVIPDIKNPDRYFTGYSQAVIGEGMVNKTAALENCECVPLDTEILTREGFKFYHQINSDEEILTHNVAKNYLEWQKIKAVNVFDDASLVEMRTSRFRAVCTANHKWAVNNGTKTKLIPQNEIEYKKGNNKIILSAIENSENEDGRDVEAGQLGWLFSDGQLTYTKNGLLSTAYIRQSKEKNFEELIKLFGDDYREIKYPDNPNWETGREWIVLAETVRKITGLFGVNTSNDLVKAVCKMTLKELDSFYQAMMRADGYDGGIGKCDKKIIEAIQITATRLGIKTGRITIRNTDGSTKPIYILPIHKSNGAYTSEIKTRNIPPQKVWCPTLENGTWIARQNGQVWITGNTSAVGRALGMLGIGVLESIASADEMVKAGAVNSNVEEGEIIPKCSICSKSMRKAKSGKWYCRHEENGKVSWGDAIFAPKQSDKEKEFSEGLDEEEVVVVAE